MSSAPRGEELPPESVERLLVPFDGAAIDVGPGETSAQLDALLEEEDAETAVFVPLFKPKKKKKKKTKRNEGSGRSPYVHRIEKQKAKLSGAEWHDSELAPSPRSETGEPVLPMVHAFDVRRYSARFRAEELGVETFYWYCRGGTLEVCAVAAYDDDEPFDVDTVRTISRDGLADMRRTLAERGRVTESLAEVGAGRRKLQQLAAYVLGFGVLACLVVGVLAFVVEDGAAFESFEWRLAAFLFHPLVIPTLVVCAYQRRWFGSPAHGLRRELRAGELAEGWNANAPHFLAVWALTVAGIALLSLAGLIAHQELGVAALVDDTATYALIVLWILTPLTYARDTSSALGSAISGGIVVLIAVVILKFTLWFTNLFVRGIWHVLIGVMGLAVPDWIRVPFSTATEVAAELFVFAVFSGYSWMKTREGFGRWATVRKVKQG